MTKTIRWGILGAGKISAKFAAGLGGLSGATLAGVAARSLARAEAFATEYGAANAYGSYEALLADPDIDVVYIGTVNTAHHDNVLLCLEAGKPVLCEKPFTLNAEEAEVVIARAREKKLFLMEAMWTRFFPVIQQVRDWLREERIGDVRLVQAAFGHTSGKDPGGRLLNPALGGGSLLDVGIYPLAFAAMVYGAMPEEELAMAHIGATGVDEEAGLLLRFPSGGLAVLASSVVVQTGYDAHISGTNGTICVQGPFWRPTSATLHRDGEEVARVSEPYIVNGYEYEAAEVMRCLREGLTESPVMPLDESIALMRLMDRIRAGWGLRYPGEA